MVSQILAQGEITPKSPPDDPPTQICGVFRRNIDTSTITMNLSIIQDDPKLLDDSGEVSKPNGVVGVGGPISTREIIFLLDKNLVK